MRATVDAKRRVVRSSMLLNVADLGQSPYSSLQFPSHTRYPGVAHRTGVRERLAFTVTLTALGLSISAPTASEAVRKAKALTALGKDVAITDPDGEVVDLRALELVVRKKKLP